MKRIEIVNHAKGKKREEGRAMAEAVSEEIEKLARREAAKNNFDISKEPNGLMRAIMQVMKRPELLKEAGRLAREKLEKAGVLPAEDPKIVKRPGKDT